MSSYPPIPVPAAAIALDAVRSIWQEGAEVIVMSPRASAAHLWVPITGVFAGRRLRRARIRSQTQLLVLIVEPGVPFPPTPPSGMLGGRWRAWADGETARRLARSMRDFDHSTLVITGDLGVAATAVNELRRAASEVSERTTEAAPDGVTALGPPEVTLAGQPRRLAGIAVRRALGSHAPTVSRFVRGLPRRARRIMSRR